MSFSAVQNLPSWLPYLEYAIIGLAGAVVLMTVGCACLKLAQVLGYRSKNEREKKKHNKRRIFEQARKKPRKSQIMPASMDF
jgi:beta-lactamase regulating signal transducer with metallopeptidase domain